MRLTFLVFNVVAIIFKYEFLPDSPLESVSKGFYTKSTVPAGSSIQLSTFPLREYDYSIFFEDKPKTEILAQERTLYDYATCERVSFWLYTRETPQGVEVKSSRISIGKAGFPVNGQLKVLIHGFAGNRSTSPNDRLRPAYLEVGKNVLSVDYSSLAEPPRYVYATSALPLVAWCTANFLDHLVLWERLDLRQLHVLGFSLGAHVAGSIARYLQSGRLPRVTGLDPAGPLFRFPGATYLSNRSAELVDVIHTNPIAGLLGPVGHVDVYFNLLIHQPGCPFDLFYCDHRRAVAYYAESILSPRAFQAFRCPSLTSFLFQQCKPKRGQIVRVGEHLPRG